jgi:FkbM family methyltransferase
MNVKDAAKAILGKFGLAITQKSELMKLIQLYRGHELMISKLDLIDVILKGSGDVVAPKVVIEAGLLSTSQLGQDLFALSQTGFKRNGFFVEFGATNGVDLSNSLLLEKNFGWDGILVEPSKAWHPSLKMNRGVAIDFSCIWTKSDIELDFNETDAAQLSTIDTYSSLDFHAELRESGRKYKVKTLSLNDLLEKYSAPIVIDYLSIDTEGSEFEILEAVDFDKWKFRLITCEHNYTPNRLKIEDLLFRNGYKRVLTEISKFDDWYVLDKW